MHFRKLVFWACPGGHPPHSEPPPLLGWAGSLLVGGQILNPFYGEFRTQKRERRSGERPVLFLKLKEMTLKPRI